MRLLVRALVVIAVGSFASISLAQDCDPAVESLEGMPIVEITIDNQDIFDTSDPEQSLWIHRAANNLHIKTRRQTIAGQLLFEVGDLYRADLARETERLLRSRSYIHHARILAEPVCAEGVRVNVMTTDNWTLTPNISASRSGGDTRTSVELEESNLLGYGTRLNLRSASDEERDTNSIGFRDPNWLGDFKALDISFADNSDGYRQDVSLAKPFVQRDSHYAWSVNALAYELENPIYEAGNRVGEIGETGDSFSISYGWSKGLLANDIVHRHRVGWSGSKKDYFSVSDPAIELPENTDNQYPFYEYQFQQVKYVERVNFRVMGVTEDIALGTRFGFRIGWKDEAYNASQPGSVFSLNYGYGSFISSKTLAIANLSLQHETNDTIDDTGRFDGGTSFYYYLDENNSYLFSGRFQAALNPELFDRIEIGGDSGLKGYPNRFQNGERALNLSVERRIYFNAYLWQLVKFGFAAFAEAGSAWDPGENPVWLGDVGAGFRLVSTRQSASRVLHIDLAFPLSETDGIDSYQLYIKARGEF